MNIGIFSGSFNPIHLGHTRLAQYILEHTDLDEIWLMVSPNNPLKKAGSLLDGTIRLELVRKATAEIAGVEASDFEFSLPRPSYTVNTLEALAKTYPEHSFSLIIGSDNMAIFHLWRDWETILRTYPVIVYPREGDDIDALRERYPRMQIVEGAPYFPVSATDIRTHLDDEELLSTWVHPAVAAYLASNPELWSAK